MVIAAETEVGTDLGEAAQELLAELETNPGAFVPLIGPAMSREQLRESIAKADANLAAGRPIMTATARRDVEQQEDGGSIVDAIPLHIQPASAAEFYGGAVALARRASGPKVPDDIKELTRALLSCSAKWLRDELDALQWMRTTA